MAVKYIEEAQQVLFGVLEPKPAKGFPQGKVRWRMRQRAPIIARVRMKGEIREYTVKEEDDCWMPAFQVGGVNADAKRAKWKWGDV